MSEMASPSTLALYFYCLTLRLVSLPGGLPSRMSGLSLKAAIQAGGLPRRLLWPAVNRSSARITSSIFVRSCRKSAIIFQRSISAK
jgi:hypothetical protein